MFSVRLSPGALLPAFNNATLTDSAAQLAIIPLSLGDQPFGSIGACGVRLSEEVLKSIGHLLTSVLERVQASEELSRQHQEVVHQRKISESLLLNILPPDIAAELRTKESDRLAVVADGLSNLGADIESTADGWRIRRSRLESGRADSQGDHRMAMLFALAGALGDGAEIAGAESVSISYPSFWSDLETLSAT